MTKKEVNVSKRNKFLKWFWGIFAGGVVAVL